MTDRELMQQALEKLEFFAHMKGVSEDTARLIAALRERLAQPEQEIDWKDQYEKQKRRAEMWRDKYEAIAGPDECIYPAQPEQELVIDCPRCGHCCPQRKPPQFPTMLRKMWSGAEVQKWINENWEQA